MNVFIDEKFDSKQNEAKIQSQLSRDLTAEMLEAETLALSKVSFPLKQKKAMSSMAAQFGASGADGDNFTATNWYVEEPAEEDQLYRVVSDLNQEVMTALSQIMDEHRIEKKANAGPSTQYLLLVSDEDRGLLTVDQVLALYLIDIAERCRKSPPIASGAAAEQQQQV